LSTEFACPIPGRNEEREREKPINVILLKYHEKFKVGISSEYIDQTEDIQKKDYNYQ